MLRYIKKTSVACLALAAMSVATFAQADYYEQYGNQGSNNWEREIPECYREVCGFLDEWGISLDTLWWEARGDGLALGSEIFVSREGFDPSTGNYADVIKGSKVKDLDFEYNTGWRFNISHALPEYRCDIKFDWTHFYTQAKAHGVSHIDPSEEDYHSYTAFMPYWETIAKNFPNSAKGKWKLDMDLFDLGVGRKYCLTSCFHLRPHFGIRAARLNQEYRVKSFSKKNAAFDFNGTSYDYVSHTTAHCDFVGVGPRLGCEAEFNMIWGVSLFGNAAGSLVYGKRDIHSHEHFENADDYYLKFVHFDGHTHNQKNDWRSRAITDLALGLKWENRCKWGTWNIPVMIALSWEHHAFFDFNDFDVDNDVFTNANRDAFDFGPYANLLPSSQKHGDLFTQGLTLSTRIGF